jgi:tetratricopeptide (TPR) repeat protein
LIDLMIPRTVAYIASGNLQAGAAFADRVLELALREGTAANIGRAYGQQMGVRFWAGDLAGAEERFMAGLKFFQDPDFVRLPLGHGVILGHASWNAWTLGRADVAREREARLMALGNTSQYVRAWWAGWYAPRLRLSLREYEQTEALAARGLELAEELQLTQVAAFARITLGVTRSQLGRAAEGIELIRRGIAACLEIGAHLEVGLATAELAAALGREGATVEALETVERALRASPEQLVHQPEILRIGGELRLKQGQTELAEADFREAIALAQKIGAKAWELRATMSLGRLLVSNGRGDEARILLTEIYNWFTEGFDTADLKDAKALLDELTA